MRRNDRVKFYKSLKKRSNLFRSYVQTVKDKGVGVDFDKNNESSGMTLQQGTTIAPSTTPVIMEEPKILSEEVLDVGQNGVKSQYKEEGDYITIEFKKEIKNTDGSSSEVVFKHYYNLDDESKSYIVVLSTTSKQYNVGSKYTYTSKEYKDLFESSDIWHDYQLKQYKYSKEKGKVYKTQRGYQRGVKKEYIDNLVKEYSEVGSVQQKEESLDEWVSDLNDAKKEELLLALKEKRGIGYRNKKEEEATEEIIEKLEESKVKENPTDDQPIHKRNKELYKSESGVALHSNFDLIPDGTGSNYRGGSLHENPEAQFKRLRDEFGIKVILKLDGSEKLSAAKEKEIVESLGMEFHFVNPHMGYQVGKGYVGSLSKIIPIMEKGNVYVHCTHGADRTGLAVGAWLKKVKNVSDDDVQELEKIYQYVTQYNRWDKIICRVSEYKDGRKLNNGYGKYLDTFYPVRSWCKAKPERANCKVCKEIDKWYPLG